MRKVGEMGNTKTKVIPSMMTEWKWEKLTRSSRNAKIGSVGPAEREVTRGEGRGGRAAGESKPRADS